MILLEMLLVLIVTGALLALLIGVLMTMPRRVINTLCRAPAVDVIVAAFTWIPWLIAGIVVGWLGVVASVIAQLGLLYGWIALHESIHANEHNGPRIVSFLNAQVGRWRNHTALLVTMIALPVLWGIRLAEIIAYPPLVWLLNFPKYRHGDWVNLSRHKFDGLIGHDLIWCLYCDWMTGVYALAGEMLRNVESFWCPIRFYDGKKCENCKLDFPDIEGGWVRADGDMHDVRQVMEEKYGNGQRSWFGHPTRLTVEGRDPTSVDHPPQ